METLETLGERIDTTKGLQSIVRTMKSLSAVSIRQYERAVAALREFTTTTELGLQVVLRQNPVLSRPDSGDGVTVALVFGSDHGLCGRFNQQIADFAVKEAGNPGASLRWLVVGVRAAARLEAQGHDLDCALFLPGGVGGLNATAERILLRIEELRAQERAARVLVFHNMRTEQAQATPRRVQLLPLDPEWLGDLQRRPWPGRTLPTFSMDPGRLFAALIRQHLFITSYRAGAESMASEHATRLAAMEAADRNIRDHLEEMNTDYRRRRQESITGELLDVVAGFECLQSQS